MHTAESSSTVCIIPGSQAPQSASHRGVKLHTTESESKVLLVSGCFQRDSHEKSLNVEHFYHFSNWLLIKLKENLIIASLKKIIDD